MLRQWGLRSDARCYHKLATPGKRRSCVSLTKRDSSGGSAERLTDVIAKAHRLRNVYKSSSKIAVAIKQAVAPFPKVVEFDNRCM